MREKDWIFHLRQSTQKLAKKVILYFIKLTYLCNMCLQKFNFLFKKLP